MDSTDRYTRQIALEEVGIEGQLRLAQAKVLVVGCGGLGSPITTLLCSSGVGHIGIVEFDTVSLSNLPRQTLYTTSDIGRPKLECAIERLSAMNPEVKITPYATRFDQTSGCDIAKEYDIIVDGCDNMATRYAMDRVSKQLGIPYVYGAIRGFEGQVSVFNHNGAGAYSDLYPPSSATPPYAPPPVMATTPTLVGTIQANEVIKIIVGYGQTLTRKLLTIDSRDYTFNIFEI
ncbi:MAG: HesA/MoeB/ThiF family protein [Rikenellaceae bacterium]